MTVVGTLASLLLLVLMVVSSCVDILEEFSVALILVSLNGVSNKRLMTDNGFWIMGVGGNNASTLPEYG